MHHQTFAVDDNKLDYLVAQIRVQGFAVIDNLLPEDISQGLLAELQRVNTAAFKRAAIGRGEDAHINNEIRTDWILWLEAGEDSVDLYLCAMTAFRLALNRALYLGLFDYECLWAYYPPGAFYERHLDAFAGSSNRRLSTVLYLNTGWQPGDGGELNLYHPQTGELVAQVPPRFGTMVVFLSEDFPHEVLPTRKPRFSVAGWFRVNNNTATCLDPPR